MTQPEALLPAPETARLPRRTFMAAAISSLVAACGGGSADGDGGGDLPDGPRLAVASLTPADGAANVEPRIEPLIRFTAPLASLPQDAELITLYDRVLGFSPTATPDMPDPSTVRLRPVLALSLASTYDIVLDKTIRGADGQAFAGQRASFTTRDGRWADAIGGTPATPDARVELQLASDFWGRTLAVFPDNDLGLIAARFTAANGWSPAEPIGAAYDVQAYAMGVAPAAGTAVAIWTAYSGTLIRLWASRMSQGEWSAPIRLDALAADPYEPALAVSRHGSAVAAWIQGEPSANPESIQVSVLDPATQEWSAQHSFAAGGAAQFWPRVGMDRNGNAVVAWASGTSVYAARYSPSMGWSARYPVLAGTGTTSLYGLMVTVSDNGDALVSVSMREGNEMAHLTTFRLRAGANSFEPAQRVRETGSTGIQNWSCVADAAGHAVMVWVAGDNTFAARFDAGAGTWSPLPGLEDGLAPQTFRRDPRLGMDLHGHLVVSWVEYSAITQNREAWVRRRLAGATAWGPALRISENGEYVDSTYLSTSPLSGESVVAWMRTNPSRAIASRLFS
jgi:hypothetical protein